MILIPHLECELTVACQLSCTACNKMVPLWRQHGIWKASPKQIEKDLNYLSNFLHADKWGALGGEPLLHPDLAEIVHIVHASNICDQIEVWTNGIELVRWCLKESNKKFWNSPVDIIVLSRYEGKLSDDDVSLIQSHCDTYGIVLEIKDERTWHNFRTNLEPVPTDDEATRAKFQGCFFRSFSRVVNNGYFYLCCCSTSMPRLLQGRSEGSDGIAVEGLTEDALRAYLERTEPLGACSICAGRDTAKPIEWREERDPVKWLQASKGLEVVGST